MTSQGDMRATKNWMALDAIRARESQLPDPAPIRPFVHTLAHSPHKLYPACIFNSKCDTEQD